MSEQGHLIFIYGTLRRGGRAHHLMRGAEFVATGSIPGRLVHVDAYPGLILCDDQRVVGELYSVHHDLLVELDGYEGCFESPPHYLREGTVVLLEDGELQAAEVYVFNQLDPSHEEITSGDWIRWKGRV